MSRQDEIRRAYWRVGSAGAVYDGLVTNSTIWGRLGSWLMWGFGAAVTREWRQAATDGLGNDFSGRLLEVPVGTDVLTLPLYP